MAGRLTTHVLDTALGTPARSMRYTLFKLGPNGERSLITRGETDGDGRSPVPLLSGSGMEVGSYSLEYDVNDYHVGTGQAPDAPFLDVVTLAFRICDTSQHLHVPLLISPFGYTTYRGS